MKTAPTASGMPEDVQHVWGADVADFYHRHNFSQRVGYGKTPALLVVDMANAFTDPRFQLGVDMSETVGVIRGLIESAHSNAVPVIFSITMFDDPPHDMGPAYRKIPALAELKRGSAAVQLDARMPRADHDLVVTKRYWSSFMMTNLGTLLTERGVDTLVISGNSTSGCVRAAATDALCYGFHPIVPRTAVTDRWDVSHHANLFDIDTKFADVVEVTDVIDYFNNSSKRTSRPTDNS